MSTLTHREKLLYGELAGVLATAAVFIFIVLVKGSFSDSDRVSGAVWPSWMLLRFLPICLSAFYLHSAHTRIDERDRLIELRGAQSGYTALCFGLLVVLWFVESTASDHNLGHIIASVFGAWLFSRAVKVVRQLELHRTQDGLLADRISRRSRRRYEERVERASRG